MLRRRLLQLFALSSIVVAGAGLLALRAQPADAMICDNHACGPNLDCLPSTGHFCQAGGGQCTTLDCIPK